MAEVIKLTEETLRGIIKTAVHQIVNENLALSKIADQEELEIIAELKDKYNNKMFDGSGAISLNGFKIPYHYVTAEGDYSDPTNKDIRFDGYYMECALYVVVRVFELNTQTKPLFKQFRTTPKTRDGVITFDCYAINGELDETSIPKSLSHELIHGIQQTKGRGCGGNGDINYNKAKDDRYSSLASKEQKTVAYLLWAFDKPEIDANLHMFAKECREVANGQKRFKDCDLHGIMLKMMMKLSDFKGYEPTLQEELLSKYGLRPSKFIKRCEKLLKYIRTEVYKIKYASESNQYTMPPKPEKQV